MITKYTTALAINSVKGENISMELPILFHLILYGGTSTFKRPHYSGTPFGIVVNFVAVVTLMMSQTVTHLIT